MRISKETGTIGAILVAILCFSAGVSLGERVLGDEKCKNSIDILAMLGNWASAICTFAAVVAALYIAAQQNKLATFGKKEAIYNAFFELKMHMGQHAGRAQMDQVSKFYYPSRESSIYFDKSLSEKIAKYYEHCFDIADLARIASELDAHEREKIRKLVSDASTLAPVIEQEMSSILRKSTIN